MSNKETQENKGWLLMIFSFTIFISLLFFVTVLFSKKAEAISLFRPFGGKVIMTSMKGISCPSGEGPITIISSSLAPPTPYVITMATRRYDYKKIKEGAWILGFYSPTMQPLCLTNSDPPVPFPAFPIILFGSSKIRSLSDAFSL